MTVGQHSGAIRRRLRVVRWVGWVDLILLVALIIASRTGNRELVRVLGPLHGINFLVLVAIVSTAAVDGLWTWWFPAAVFFTGGPVGALVGEWYISRRTAQKTVSTVNTADPLPTRGDDDPPDTTTRQASQGAAVNVHEGSSQP